MNIKRLILRNEILKKIRKNTMTVSEKFRVEKEINDIRDNFHKELTIELDIMGIITNQHFFLDHFSESNNIENYMYFYHRFFNHKIKSYGFIPLIDWEKALFSNFIQQLALFSVIEMEKLIDSNYPNWKDRLEDLFIMQHKNFNEHDHLNLKSITPAKHIIIRIIDTKEMNLDIKFFTKFKDAQKLLTSLEYLAINYNKKGFELIPFDKFEEILEI